MRSAKNLGPQRPRRFVDIAPLKYSPAFARLWVGQSVSGIGAQLTIMAVGLQIYDITESTFAVGLVGGVTLLPMIAAGIWGGMIVDAFDRRTVAILATIVGWVATLGLVGASYWDAILSGTGERAEVWPFYVIASISSVASTISAAARSAAIPRLLPPHLVSRATALNGIGFGLQLTVGPALAGVLVAIGRLPAHLHGGCAAIYGRLHRRVRLTPPAATKQCGSTRSAFTAGWRWLLEKRAEYQDDFHR